MAVYLSRQFLLCANMPQYTCIWLTGPVWLSFLYASLLCGTTRKCSRRLWQGEFHCHPALLLLRLKFTSLCRRRGSIVADALMKRPCARFERNSRQICRSGKCFEGEVAGSLDSSVVIATGYGAGRLGNPGSIPSRVKRLYSSKSVLTGCGDHRATYPVWEGVISAGVQRTWRETTISI
jgi:hypothetical protein